MKPPKQPHYKAYRERMKSDPVTAEQYLARGRANARNWRKKNPEAMARIKRREKLKRFYGMTLEQWDEMFEAQGRMCAVCKDTSVRDNPRICHTDHCHTTGKVRGILCTRCNTAIGYAKDNPQTLRALADYVEHHQNKNP